MAMESGCTMGIFDRETGGNVLKIGLAVVVAIVIGLLLVLR